MSQKEWTGMPNTELDDWEMAVVASVRDLKSALMALTEQALLILMVRKFHGGVGCIDRLLSELNQIHDWCKIYSNNDSMIDIYDVAGRLGAIIRRVQIVIVNFDMADTGVSTGYSDLVWLEVESVEGR